MHLQTARRRPFAALLIPAALCLLAPAAAPAAKESGIRFDPQADFGSYETYDWAEGGHKPEGSPMAVGGAIDTKVRNAIDRELRTRGYEPAIDEEPDFLISFDGAMETVTDFEGLRQEITGGVTWVMEGGINSYRRGTLMISIDEAGSGKAVWSAWTTEKVKDPKNPDKQIDKAVRKLLKKFPPR